MTDALHLEQPGQAEAVTRAENGGECCPSRVLEVEALSACGAAALGLEAEGGAPTAASVWLVMMKASRSLGALAEQSIVSQGMGLSDFMILEALLHKGPMKIGVLGEKVHLANASMTAAVDRLEARGLVARQSGEADRRVRTVQLTGCGGALIERLYRKHESDLEMLLKPLSAEERTALRGSLKKVGLAAEAALGAKGEVVLS